MDLNQLIILEKILKENGLQIIGRLEIVDGKVKGKVVDRNGKESRFEMPDMQATGLVEKAMKGILPQIAIQGVIEAATLEKGTQLAAEATLNVQGIFVEDASKVEQQGGQKANQQANVNQQTSVNPQSSQPVRTKVPARGFYDPKQETSKQGVRTSPKKSAPETMPQFEKLHMDMQTQKEKPDPAQDAEKKEQEKQQTDSWKSFEQQQQQAIQQQRFQEQQKIEQQRRTQAQQEQEKKWSLGKKSLVIGGIGFGGTMLGAISIPFFT